MRSFLVRLGTFLALLLLCYLSILVLVVARSQRVAAQCGLRQDAHSIILGDSHTMWSLDDSQIPGVQNVSLNGEGYRYSYEKLQLLLTRDNEIRRVYLGFGPHNLSSYYDDYIFGGSFKFFVARYLGVLGLEDYLNVARYSPAELVRVTRHAIVDGVKPALKGQCELLGGFPAETHNEVYDVESMERRIRSQYYSEDGRVLGISTSNRDYMQKIVALCKAHDVELVLVNTPTHEDYERRIPEKFKRELASLIAKTGARYYDFNDLSLPDSAFLPDGDHLNYTGAMLTTKQFAAFHPTF